MAKRASQKFGTLVIAALLTITLSLAQSAETQAKLKPCARDYIKHFIKGPTHKAVATTGGRSPLGPSALSCGTSWGYATKKQAIKEALRQCRITDRKYKDRGSCQIIGVR